MKRIIIHWTGGSWVPSPVDKAAYHFIINGEGKVVEGVYKPEDNLSTATPYAAHTRKLNTGSIGVAIAAMRGAKESPLHVGDCPIKEEQVDALIGLCVDLCNTYDIQVSPSTVLTHAEVQGTLGVRQRNKWDITWLPALKEVKHPTIVGDILRNRMLLKMNPPTPEVKPNAFVEFIKALIKAFTKGGSNA